MFLFVPLAFAGGDLTIGEDFPGLLLPRPDEPALVAYLGLGEESSDFHMAHIKADLVVVEFFSMYCPHCQHEAPLLNKVYELLHQDGLDTRVKMVGIGIGNSPYEVGIFQKKFHVPFPLFADEEYVWHKQVGQVGTPYFVFVVPGKGGAKVAFTHLGRIDSAPWFVKQIEKYL
jgi:thiol-disulfide isomerase/thioredoxin